MLRPTQIRCRHDTPVVGIYCGRVTLSHSSTYYSVAGVIVRARPVDLQAVTARLSASPGIDIHYQDADTGRLVITLETECLDQEQAGIERVRNQAGVISADLVYHFIEPPESDGGSANDPERGGS